MPAVRHRYGGDLTGYVFDVSDTGQLTLQPGAVVTVWDAQTAGSQYTDLRGSNGTTPITSVSTGTGDSAGFLPVFYGPAGVAAMWAQAGAGPRALIVANDLADTISAGSTETLFSLGSRSGAFAVDQVNGGVQTVTLTGNISPTIAAPDQVGRDVTLVLTQDATGGRTVTWPSNVKLTGGALRLSTAAAAIDMVSFRWDGVNWRERTRALASSQDGFTSWVNVRDFGAVGNGITDDGPAIQKAIDFAASIGTAIWLPAGTYAIQPSTQTAVCLKLTTGLKGIHGAGSGVAGFRVMNAVSQYYAILGAISLAGPTTPAPLALQNVTGATFRDFFVDQNTTNNIVADPSGAGPLFHSYPRLALNCGGGAAQIRVFNVRFIDTDGVNTINIQGRDIWLENCEFVVSDVASDHDHSAIYFNNNYPGGHCSIKGNLLYANNPGNVGARTAIETHGGAQQVIGNTVRNYFKAGNLTGANVYTNDGIHWIGNSFVNIRFGVQIWSNPYAGNPGPYGVRNLHIRNNSFRMDPYSWTPTGATSCVAIFLDTTAGALPIVDAWIDGNDISYPLATIAGTSTSKTWDKSLHVGNVGDSASHAIDWRRTSAALTPDRNLNITNNSIYGALASAIRIVTVGADYIDGLNLSGNKIRNSGQSSVLAGGGMNNGFANGMMILGILKNARIQDNDIMDDQATPTSNYGIFASAPAAGGSNNLIAGNRIGPVAVAPLLFSTSFEGGYLVRQDYNQTWVAPVGTVALGSEIRVLPAGVVYRQTASPYGSTWTSYTPGVSSGGGGTATPPDIQTFTASGTWTRPTGAKVVLISMVGAGGGGGSGRRGAVATVRCGGGGGGGGGYTQVMFDASALGGSVAVTVGAAGTGGLAVTTDDTSGAAGVTGGSSIFGAFARAWGGTGGGGGGLGVAGAAGAGTSGTSLGGNGATSSSTGAVGNNAGTSAGPAGGGGGGGINATTTPNAAGVPTNGGASVSTFGAPAGGNGGGGGVVDAAAPTAGGSVTSGLVLPGGGGGGGAASITATAQSGADGGNYGAGGGGGGAALNTFNSGAGGSGAPGLVQVVTYF